MRVPATLDDRIAQALRIDVALVALLVREAREQLRQQLRHRHQLDRHARSNVALDYRFDELARLARSEFVDAEIESFVKRV